MRHAGHDDDVMIYSLQNPKTAGALRLARNVLLLFQVPILCVILLQNPMLPRVAHRYVCSGRSQQGLLLGTSYTQRFFDLQKSRRQDHRQFHPAKPLPRKMAPFQTPSSDPPKYEMQYFPDMTTALPSESGEFRRVLWTGLYSQLVLMTIPVGGDIGEEVSISHSCQISLPLIPARSAKSFPRFTQETRSSHLPRASVSLKSAARSRRSKQAIW